MRLTVETHSRIREAAHTSTVIRMRPLATLGPLLVCSALAIHTCIAATFHTNQSTDTFNHKPCLFQGREITAHTYIDGSPGVPGSVYGVCRDGVLLCYQEPTANSFNQSLAALPMSCPTTSPRRLVPDDEDPAKVCVYEGRRVDRLQYLHNDPPNTLGSYFAICLEFLTKPKLVCVMDDGLLDRTNPMHVVDCKEVPALRSQRPRQLGTYDANIREKPTGTLWPNGVVCYALGTINADYKTHMESVFTTHVKPVFDDYEKNSCIRFVDIDKCATEAPAGSCNNCKHYMRINAPRGRRECYSAVGYQPRAPVEPDEHTAMREATVETNEVLPEQRTSQPLYLGAGTTANPSICLKRMFIAHEIGHTLGLLHDHQRIERKQHVMVHLQSLKSQEDMLEMARYELEEANAALELITDKESDDWEQHSKDALQAQATITALAGTVAAFEMAYAIRQAEAGGEYDMNSIMHYDDTQNMCVPFNRPGQNDPKPSEFCDYGQTKRANNCIPGAQKHCDPKAAKEAWPDARRDGFATTNDHATIRALYGFPDSRIVNGKCTFPS